MPNCEHRQIKEANLELCSYRGIRVQIRFFFSPLGEGTPRRDRAHHILVGSKAACGTMKALRGENELLEIKTRLM